MVAKIQKASNDHRFLEASYGPKKGIKTSKTIIKRLAKYAEVDPKTIKDIDLDGAITNLKNAWKDFNRQKEKFPEYRKEFNISLIKSMVKDEKVRKQVIKDRMKREEASRILGKRARRIRGKKQKNPVLRAEIKDANGSTKELNCQASIVSAIAQSNRNRQQQCLGTPFMTNPLVDIFGYLPSEELATQVGNGTFEIPNNVSSFKKDFLEECKIPESIRQRKTITLKVSPEENKRAWKKKRDHTGCAYGSLGFAYYKASSTDRTLNEIDAFLRSTPTEVGVIPEGWLCITDVEILKKACLYDIEKMRCIQLMDSEFNRANGQLGKEVLANAEAAKEVEAEQFGSRKRHRASTACLCKVIMADLFRQIRQAGAFAMNDAIGCYDRIQHTVALLVLMRFGLAYTPAKILLEVLQLALHRIKTGYGTSKPVYGNSKTPEQGLGQGNSQASTFWVLISFILIRIMKKEVMVLKCGLLYLKR